MESDRVDQVDSLLLHEAYLDGFLDVCHFDSSSLFDLTSRVSYARRMGPFSRS